VTNSEIADRLDAFASLLELGDANPYTARAYRRAAETIRNSATPVTELVRTGRVRELRGIGPGIEARLRELVALGNMELSVRTARRGWATVDQVVNTRPLASILDGRRSA
jgi:DNA polymerase/3'-5' exonuclease PolX